MKIAFVTSIFDGPELDSVTSDFFLSLCRIQVERGHTVRVFTLGDADRQEIRSGASIIYSAFDAKRFQRFGSDGLTPVFGWCLSRSLALHAASQAAVADFAPDVIQCVKALDAIGWIAEGRVPVALVSVTPQLEIMRRGLNGIFTALDTALVTGLEAMVLGCLDAVSVPSLEMAELLASVSGRTDATVYPHAVDLPAPVRDEAPPYDAGPTVLYVGSVDSYKGADLLVEALARAAPRLPALRVTFAGEEAGIVGVVGTLTDQLRRRLDALGLGSRVTFRPPLAPQEYPRAFASATVVAFPFRYCGTMYHLLQAMAHGGAVVATRVGTVAEAIVHGESGYLVPPEDPQGLAEAIVALTSDGALRGRLRSGARRYVQARCTTDELGRFLEELSRSACSRARDAHRDASIRMVRGWFAALEQYRQATELPA